MCVEVEDAASVPALPSPQSDVDFHGFFPFTSSVRIKRPHLRLVHVNLDRKLIYCLCGQSQRVRFTNDTRIPEQRKWVQVVGSRE